MISTEWSKAGYRGGGRLESLRGTDNVRWLSQVSRQARGLSPPFFQRQRQLLRCLDAIAAIALGLIKRAIGGREQPLQLRAGRTARHADADGGIDRAGLGH